jgi:F420-dependent oxidoreductase-like protein
MRLGLMLGYSGSHYNMPLDLVREADELGYDSVWTAEAYGSDAVTPATWVLANTKRIKAGTAIMQLAARSPSCTAMTAMTLDHLSGGRFVLGLGPSGPQVVEGWHGERYGKPLTRLKEYVSIVRQILAREAPVTHQGEHYQIPYRGEGSSGLGKPLKSTIHPFRTEIPIYLGAEGPKNVARSAEICDGWLPLFFSPKDDDFYRQCLAEGFTKAGDPGKADRFDVACGVMIIPGDDVEKCADFVRPFLALYAGGMGARGANVVPGDERRRARRRHRDLDL